MNSLTRRDLLRGFAVAGGLLGALGRSPIAASTAQARTPDPNAALALARFLNRTRFSDLPDVAITHAKMLVASTLASAAAGSRFPSARAIRDLAKEQGGRSDSTVWFGRVKVPMPEAARVNAMLSDAAASDDSDLRNVAHSGTCVVATGLAVGERTRATGQDLLCAIVTGYEAAGRVGEALAGSGPGFHASVVVAFGGAVAAAKLLGSTDEQMANALRLTATTMGGLGIGTNSWAREYHAGNAALSAVHAALAASRGFTANDDMLEAPRGFLQVFSGGKADTESLSRDVGKQWDIVTHLAIKLVPGAHAFHPSVEAAVNAARQSTATPEDVAKILVSGSQVRALAGGRPKDFVEAIHSLPYFIASAVADKDFSWVHATEEKIHSPIVGRLIDLIEPDQSPPAAHYEWNWGGAVTIVTKSGGRYTSSVDAPRGSGPRGIAWRDVDAKFRALMPASNLSPKRIEETLNLIHELERANNVSALTGHLL